jgi:hypothetical protein
VLPFHLLTDVVSERCDQGPIFRTFFPRKIPWNLLEKRFFETFSAENSNFFPTFFGGKFSAEFSPEKMYEKSAPDEFMKKLPKM